jgi:hypothetical protein
VLAAPLSIAWIILRYGVNVAAQDQIRIGAFLVRNHGRWIPRLADLFAQHNESRKFFPRLIFFYLAKLTGWNVKYEMGAILVIACGILVVVALFARRSGIGPPAVALAALLLFSPVQWWNWLFGIQVVVFLPLLMLVLALFVATGPRPLRFRIAIAAVCCLIATYSYANGMLTWFLVAPALFARREDRTARAAGSWIVMAGAAIALYFVGYHRPSNSPSMLPALGRPFDVARFVLAFIGHPLAWSDALWLNAILGALACGLFVFLAMRAGRAGLPWTILAFYSLASAGVAALGRIGMGEELAVEPRYTTFAIGLWIALVMLAAMTKMRGRAAAAILLLVLHGAAIHAAWPRLRENHRDRLVAKAATQFALVLEDKSLFQRLIEMDVALSTEVVTGLAKIGYVNPAPVGTDLIQPLNAGSAAGAFEGVLRLDDGRRVFYGWAILPGGGPADAVLITNAGHVVAISERTVFRADRPGMGWDLPVTARLAQPGATYTAWAYDTSTRRAYELSGFVKVGRRSGGGSVKSDE